MTKELKIVSYGVRDLHAIDPDDEQAGVHDVVAKFDDGSICHSEGVYDSRKEAESFLQEQIATPWPAEDWLDKPTNEGTGERVYAWITAKEQ